MNKPAETLHPYLAQWPDLGTGPVPVEPVVSPEYFEREREAIFKKVWLNLGRAEDIPNPGDYRTERIGLQPIIIARDSQHRIRVYLNRCRHRANTVCEKRRGHAMTLTCCYHGWTYSIDGHLQGVPFHDDYGPHFNKQDRSLLEVPRVDSYRGFLFASLAADGPSLREHLGLATTLIDRYCDISPSGEVAMNVGVFRMKVKTNWKMWIENSVDGYHVPSTHASNFYMAQMTENRALKQRTAAAGKGVFSVIRMRDLGRGHSELDMRPQRRITGMTYSSDWSQGVPEAAQRAYTDGVEARLGKERAAQVLVDGPAHAVVFPNLFLIFQDIRWCVPVSVNETYLYYAGTVLPGAPDEINQLRLRREEGAYGPAGFQLADDLEVWERNFRGLAARADEWIDMSRGVGLPVTADEEGVPTQADLSELTIRAQWAHYRQLMQADR